MAAGVNGLRVADLGKLWTVAFQLRISDLIARPVALSRHRPGSWRATPVLLYTFLRFGIRVVGPLAVVGAPRPALPRRPLAPLDQGEEPQVTRYEPARGH